MHIQRVKIPGGACPQTLTTLVSYFSYTIISLYNIMRVQLVMCICYCLYQMLTVSQLLLHERLADAVTVWQWE